MDRLISTSGTLDSSSTPLDPSPRFPVELEREIFEIVALLDPGSAPRLVLVASRVHEWIEPSIYRVLVKHRSFDNTDKSTVHEYPLLEQFEYGRDVPPRLRKVCTYTTDLLLQGIPANEASEILKLCVNVSNLGLWLLKHLYTPLLSVLPSLPIKRLSIDPYSLFLGDSGFHADWQVLNNITHLDLIDISRDLWLKEGGPLGRLPNLTHLAIQGGCATEIIKPVLANSNTLKLLILFGNFALDDTRFVSFDSPDFPLNHWTAGAHTGVDFWGTGEEIQRKKITSSFAPL